MPVKTKLPQLLKWVGNKHRFAEEIVSYMPKEINVYYEPFLGSGAVLATLAHAAKDDLFAPKVSHFYGSDILPELIGVFNYVKNNPQTLIDYYRSNIEHYSEDKSGNYKKILDKFNNSRSPLDFAVLSRTCYSGIIRFRKRDGHMSTPVGPHNPISPESFEERVMFWNSLLKEATFQNCDFSETMARAKQGDLVYCDPPYTHSQTILYGAQGFKIDTLWNAIYDCKQRGAKVMLSINGTKKSKQEDIGVVVPDGLFERSVSVNCGISMVNRLQRAGAIMDNENVDDQLLFTW